METTDIALIGAGPIGIEMAVALKQSDLTYTHLEAGNIGSTIAWYPPETPFFSSPERIAIAGVPLGNQRQSKATREEYLTYLRMVVEQYQLSIRTYERVISLATNDEHTFALETQRSFSGASGPDEIHYRAPETGSKTLRAKKVILAIGDMHVPNMLNIPGESLPHVSHYFEEPHKYFSSKVVVVGGNNSAVEAAIRLARVGADVTISYRNREFNKQRIKHWLYPDLLYLVRSKKIRFLPETKPLEIDMHSVLLTSSVHPESSVTTVPADYVLLLTGYKQKPSLFEGIGIELTGPGLKPAWNIDTMETNISGVYVAGTAVAGTQFGGVKEFIETSHIHVRRIINHLTNKKPPQFDPDIDTSFVEN